MPRVSGFLHSNASLPTLSPSCDRRGRKFTVLTKVAWRSTVKDLLDQPPRLTPVGPASTFFVSHPSVGETAMRARRSRQNLEGWVGHKTTPAPPIRSTHARLDDKPSSSASNAPAMATSRRLKASGAAVMATPPRLPAASSRNRTRSSRNDVVHAVAFRSG